MLSDWPEFIPVIDQSEISWKTCNRRGLETMQMLKKLKAENEAKEAKSKENDSSKNSKNSDKESGLAKTDEKVRKALESSEKKSEKNADDISDKTRALLEDKKSKDASKAAPPPPPPKKPKDLGSDSPDSSSVRARKSVSLGSLIGKKDSSKENGDDKKRSDDKPTKRSSSDKRNTNSPTGKVQSKMTSFVTKDDKKDRRDSITTGTKQNL